MINSTVIITSKPDPNRGSTAWFIFDRSNLYQFDVNQAHFRVKNGTHNHPIMDSVTYRDRDHLENAMMTTNGTIIEMSDLYRDGARLVIKSAETAKRIYIRILNHLDAHFDKMTTSKHYTPPNDDTLKELAEFATAIYAKALQADPNLDKTISAKDNFKNMATYTRAFIEPMVINKVNEEPKEIVLPKSVTTMDAIERYLLLISGG